MNQFFGREYNLQDRRVGIGCLVVTCPVIVLELLRQHLNPNVFTQLMDQIDLFLDGIQSHPVHGVFEGMIKQDGPRSSLGLHKIHALWRPENSVFTTDETLAGLNTRSFVPKSPETLLLLSNSSVSNFEQEHPWFKYVDLTDDQRTDLLVTGNETSLLMMLTLASAEDLRKVAAGKPKILALLDRGEDDEAREALVQQREDDIKEKKTAYTGLYLVLPDTTEMRAELAEIWADTLKRLA